MGGGLWFYGIKDLSEKVEIKELRGTFGKDPSEEELLYRAYKIPAGPHPVEVLRPFAMMEAIQQTALDKISKGGWIQLIKGEINSKELAKEKVVKLMSIDTKTFPPTENETVIPVKVACCSAAVVGKIIATTKLSSLGTRNISEIFKWSMKDEAFVDVIRQSFSKETPLPGGASANHIVAAAVMESSRSGADIESLFRKMKQYLIKVRGRA